MPMELQIPGEPAKPFRVFRCDRNGEPYELEAEYETIAQVRAHRYRLDRTYRIYIRRRPYTRFGFEEWAKQHA